MATFRNRHGKWQARVQRKGQQPVSKSFQSKDDAQRWARQVEAEIDKGSYTNVALAERTPLKDVIERYIQEVTLQTRSMKEDRYRLGAMMRHWIGSLTMIQLTPAKVAQYRDERLKKVSAGAVIRELAYISSIINHSRREWGINMTNPLPFVKKPPEGKERIRAAHLKHGQETQEARAERNAKSLMFRYLTDIDNHFNIFYKQLKTRGRPPSGYAQLDLSNPEQLAVAIIKNRPKK